ncbi:MAG: iron-containing alcohol dehydrogenase [Erysipelotrichaceae bacterium]|nr:iron-containing alcohol dehydrogenase [Erysipelotrichaceae bacterium]
MDNFIYNIPTKVYFGKGEEDSVGKYLKEYKPHKVLLHYGGNSAKKSGLLDKVKKALEEEGISYVELGGVRPNPELSLVRDGIELCKREGVDFILAVGGGSVIDSMKAIANGVANPEDDVWDYHLGKKKPQKTLKKAAILTLSAAGSEMSNSCVISNDLTKEKRGCNGDFNRIDFAICNPELTYSVSKYQTACGIVDIAMHTIERYFALGTDTELTDALSEAIIKTVFAFGKEAINNPYDYNARAQLMLASSFAHNGLTNMGKTPLLTVHQLEHEVSALYPNVAHGAGLAALWPSWARYVYKYNLPRFKQYAKNVWNIDSGDDEKDVLEAIDKQEQYYHDIGMPISLFELDVKESDLEYLAFKTSREKTRIIPGYKPLSYEDDLAIFKMAYKK